MNLGNSLRELLELNNITQKELAEKLAFAPSTLGNYIQGTREPDYNTLLIIADYFHVTTDFLLGHKASAYTLTHDEELLLHLFRSLTSEQQEFYLEQGKIFLRQNNKKTSSYSDGNSRNAV